MTAENWVIAATHAWANASAGHDDVASDYVMMANNIANGSITMIPELEILRHRAGEITDPGVVMPYSLDEDSLLGIEDAPRVYEAPSAQGMKRAVCSWAEITWGLKRYKFDPLHHAENIKTELPHVMVMSTGRCGTVSLYRLLQQTQYLAYHAYPYTASPTDRFEMMCRHLTGDYSDHTPDYVYAKTRAAEWLGGISVNRPVAMLNHLDTIFAPTFAKIHPKAKFVFLRRDPVKAFASFYGKGQWNDGQLQEIFYSFSPDFQWKFTGNDAPYTIAWYLRFTEVFSRAFGQLMGDRWIEISSDRLFAQNSAEIERLKDFLELDLSVMEIQDHFSRPFNEKLHKALYDPSKGIKQFEKAYAAL